MILAILVITKQDRNKNIDDDQHYAYNMSKHYCQKIRYFPDVHIYIKNGKDVDKITESRAQMGNKIDRAKEHLKRMIPGSRNRLHLEICLAALSHRSYKNSQKKHSISSLPVCWNQLSGQRDNCYCK